MAKRNAMERQAISALAHLANGVLFVLDPTETCGYTVEDQRRLLEEIRALLPKVPFVVVANKADIGATSADAIAVSALNAAGTREAVDALLAKLTSRDPEGGPRSAGP
jgi:nucleolar GTP-binding protein